MCNKQGQQHNLQNEKGDLLFIKLARSFLLAFPICLFNASLSQESKDLTARPHNQAQEVHAKSQPSSHSQTPLGMAAKREETGSWCLSLSPETHGGGERQEYPMLLPPQTQAPSPWHRFHCSIRLELYSTHSKIKLVRISRQQLQSTKPQVPALVTHPESGFW